MIDEFSTRGQTTYKDWEYPTAPIPREVEFGPSSDIIRPPDPSQDKSLPQYAVIQPEDVSNFFRSVSTSFEKGIGAYREFLPPLGFVGDRFSDVGKSIEQSPAGPGLDVFREKATGGFGKLAEWTVVPVLQAIINRLGETNTQVGKTFSSDNPDAFKFLDAIPRIIGGLVLGKTGSGAFDFGADPNFDTLGDDLKDTLAILAIVPIVKGATAIKGVIGGAPAAEAFFNNSVTKVLSGMGKTLETTTSASKAEAFGQYTGRFIAETSLIGASADWLLPKIAPDSPVTERILNNRFVSEQDSPWRFPLEAVTTLPLDIFGAIKLVNESKTAQLLSRATKGPPKLPSQIYWDNKVLNNAIDGNVATAEGLNHFDQQSIFAAATEEVIAQYNEMHTVAIKNTTEMVGVSDEVLSAWIKDSAKTMEKTLGKEGLYKRGWESITTIMERQSPDWARLPPIEQIQTSMEYLRASGIFESPNRVLAVVSEDITFATARQSVAAYDYLLGMTGNTVNDYNILLAKYPSTKPLFEQFLHDGKFDIDGAKRSLAGDWAITGRADDVIDWQKSAASLRGDLAYEKSLPTTPVIPPSAPNTTRLYRGERGAPGTHRPVPTLEEWLKTASPGMRADPDMGRRMWQDLHGDRGTFWTESEDIAASFADIFGDKSREPHKYYVDVPNDVLKTNYVRGKLSAEYSAKAKRVETGRGAAPGPTGPTADAAKITDLEKQIARLEQNIASSGQPRAGTIDAMITAVNKRIAEAGKKDIAGLAAERSGLITQLNTAIARELEPLGQRIDVLKTSMEGKMAQTLNTNLTKEELLSLDQAIAVLRRDLSASLEEYGLLKESGYRWRIQDISGPTVRASDAVEAAKLLVRGQRTGFGKVYDALFGGLPTTKFRDEAYDYLRTHLEEVGVDKTLASAFEDNLSEARTQATWKVKGRELPFFGTSIFNMPVWTVTNVAKKTFGNLLDQSGKFKNGTTPYEILYRSMPGPLKIFSEAVFGKSVDVPYNPALVELSRHLYPMMRFTLSPRFFMMNLFEPQIIGGALGGKKFADATATRHLTNLSEQAFRESVLPGGIESGNAYKSMAKLGFTMKEDVFTQAWLDLAEASPEMADFLKQYGTRDKWYGKISEAFTDRQKIASGVAASTKEELAIVKQMEDLKAKAGPGVGEQGLLGSELSDLQEKLDSLLIPRRFEEVRKVMGVEKSDMLEKLLGSAVQGERQMMRDLRQTFFGNPDRSAAERLANSFLLYWPISYQIKAAKDLAEFLTHKAFGYRTGSVGLTTYQQIRDDAERGILNDPETNAFFQKNKQLLFILRQFVPITPEDLGVTLSKYTRAPFDLLGGKPFSQVVTGATTIGPIYDHTLIERLMVEQSKPESIVGKAMRFNQ